MTIDVVWHDGKVSRVAGTCEVVTLGGAAILRVLYESGSVMCVPLWHVKSWRTWP